MPWKARRALNVAYPIGSLLPLRRRAAELQKRLQNQDGGKLIDHLSPATDAHVGFAQNAICLHRGQPFVKKVDWKLEPVAELFGEFLDFPRLNSLGPTHTQGQSHHDLANGILPDDVPQMIEIVFFVAAPTGGQSLSSQSKLVADRQPDVSRTEVQCENAERR